MRIFLYGVIALAVMIYAVGACVWFYHSRKMMREMEAERLTDIRERIGRLTGASD